MTFGSSYAIDTSKEILLENKAILSSIRIDIMQKLCESPKTAYTLSKEIDKNVSTIYRNLDVLSAYSLIYIYKVEPYKQVVKKYYVPSIKGFFGVFGYLKSYAYNFYFYFNNTIFHRWGFDIDPHFSEKYAKLSSDKDVLEQEFSLMKKFLKEYPYTLDDLNDIMSYLTFIIYVINNVKNSKVKKLELDRIGVLAEVAIKYPSFYEIIKKRIAIKSKCGMEFLKHLTEMKHKLNEK